MSQSTKTIKDKIAQILTSGRLDKTPLDYITTKIICKIYKDVEKAESDEAIQHQIGETFFKESQNQSYKEFLAAINLSFDDLSKTSKESVHTISQITSDLMLREPSEDLLLSELISLVNEEATLEQNLQALQEENEFLRKVDEDIDAIIESSGTYQKEVENKRKENNTFAKSVEDRLNDILRPKNEEYSAQLSQLNKKGLNYPYEVEITHEKIEFLHNKMLGLQNNLEDSINKYGDLGSIPATLQEAVQILERKRERTLELEQQLRSVAPEPTE